MVSIGHRTGLFDAMSQSPPARSEEIAARTGLNERYVREWLGAMVTGGGVDFDPASSCYSLPPEHAAYLTRAAMADNMAVFGQYIQAKPLAVLKGIHRTLKPDGVYLMQDISGTSHVDKDIEHPIGTFLYTISCMHCMVVSLAQGGEGLGAMWGEGKKHANICIRRVSDRSRRTVLRMASRTTGTW